jgi:hypothetical protein
MGLEIRLYQVDNFEKMIGYYKERDHEFEKWHKEHDQIAWAEISEKFPSYAGERKISLRHTDYSSHSFSIGHFQMPYGGGIFQVLISGITGVKYIFEPLEGVDRFRPNWLGSLDRVQKLIEIKKTILQGCGVENDGKDAKFYAEALEIMSDTIKHVLAENESHLYYLGWDG